MGSPLNRLLPLAVFAILSNAEIASAEPFCLTTLPDGRVIVSRPAFDGNNLTCPPVAFPSPMTMRQEGAQLPRPSMRFTTGQIGPFTTGEIGPFTTGEIGPFTTGGIGPLTTFSNSPSSSRVHR